MNRNQATNTSTPRGARRQRSLRWTLWLWLTLAAAAPLALVMALAPGALPSFLPPAMVLLFSLLAVRLSARAVRPLAELERACRRGGENPRCQLPRGAPAELAAVADRVTALVREGEAARRLATRISRQAQSQAALRHALRSAGSSRALARAVLNVLSSGCQARAGAFYLMQGGQILELAAHFGHSGTSVPAAEIRLGEGLVGRVANQRRLGVEPLEADGDGDELVVAVPYHLTGRLKGVAVFVLGRPLSDDDRDLFAETAEPVAIALDSWRARERVQLLLNETRRQAAAYAAQQSELEKTNIRLQRSDRYKNEFLANMTHELRSPLNSMLLLSQVLTENRRGNLAVDEVDAAQVINKAGRELLVIIDDILDLTKAEAGRLELHPEDIEVADLAESLAALYRPLAARKKLDLRVTIAPGTPAACRTDPTRLSQILKNLLNNALKFTEHGSVSLDIAAAPEGIDGRPALDFVIADSGIGISAEVLPALFAAFTQGDGSIARRFGGSGLGLSICRKLSELLGARIAVSSEVGRGSTFRLRLPVSFPAGAGVSSMAPAMSCLPLIAPSLPSPPLPALQVALPLVAGAAGVVGLLAGQPILVADGDMRSVYRLTATLEAAGARVRVARDAAAALTLLAGMHPRGLALVRPQLLAVLPPHERQMWWTAAAASGARLVIITSTQPAPAEAPAGLPALDPDAPDAAICRILGGLALSAGNRGAAFAEVGS